MVEPATTDLTLALLFGMLACTLFATGAVLQHRAAHREEQTRMVSAGLLLTLLRRPLWLAGSGLGAIGIGLQAVAAHYSSLTLLQCILIFALVFVVPIGAALDRRRVLASDLVGVALCAAGVIGFLALTHPSEGHSRIPVDEALRTGGVLALAVGVFLWLAHRSAGDRRAALLGCGAGIVVGTLDALIKTSSDLASGGFLKLLRDWPIWTLCGVGILVLILEQNALRSGRLAAAQAGISIFEPVTGILIGVFAFGETLATSPLAFVIEGACALSAIIGIAMVSSSNSRWEAELSTEESSLAA